MVGTAPLGTALVSRVGPGGVQGRGSLSQKSWQGLTSSGCGRGGHHCRVKAGAEGGAASIFPRAVGFPGDSVVATEPAWVGALGPSLTARWLCPQEAEGGSMPCLRLSG